MKKTKVSIVMNMTAKAIVDFASAMGIDLTTDQVLNDPNFNKLTATLAGATKELVEIISGEDILIDCDTPGCTCNRHGEEKTEIEIKVLSLKGKDKEAKYYQDAERKNYALDSSNNIHHDGKILKGSFFLTDTQTTITQ